MKKKVVAVSRVQEVFTKKDVKNIIKEFGFSIIYSEEHEQACSISCLGEIKQNLNYIVMLGVEAYDRENNYPNIKDDIKPFLSKINSCSCEMIRLLDDIPDYGYELMRSIQTHIGKDRHMMPLNYRSELSMNLYRLNVAIKNVLNDIDSSPDFCRLKSKQGRKKKIHFDCVLAELMPFFYRYTATVPTSYRSPCKSSKARNPYDGTVLKFCVHIMKILENRVKEFKDESKPVSDFSIGKRLEDILSKNKLAFKIMFDIPHEAIAWNGTSFYTVLTYVVIRQDWYMDAWDRKAGKAIRGYLNELCENHKKFISLRAQLNLIEITRIMTLVKEEDPSSYIYCINEKIELSRRNRIFKDVREMLGY